MNPKALLVKVNPQQGINNPDRGMPGKPDDTVTI